MSHPATPMMYAIISRLVSCDGVCGAVVSGAESCCGASGAVVLSAIPLPCASGLCQQRQNLVLNRPGHARFTLADKHIHFAAHAKFRQINPRLYRITSIGDQVPHVMRFESVHVHTIAVYFFSDAVSGAMEEIFSVACFFNDAARRFVHLPSLQ